MTKSKVLGAGLLVSLLVWAASAFAAPGIMIGNQGPSVELSPYAGSTSSLQPSTSGFQYSAPLNPRFATPGFSMPSKGSNFFGGGFDFGGFNFGSFNPGSLGIDLGSLTNFDLGQFDLSAFDLSDLSLDNIGDKFNAIAGNLNALNTLALDAQGSIQSLRDGLTSSLSFDIETVFGTISTDELRSLGRNPQLFGQFLESKLVDQLSMFDQEGLDRLFDSLDNDMFQGSDLKQLISDASGAYNAYSALKSSIAILKDKPEELFAASRELAEQADDEFKTKISEKTLGDLKGNIFGHMNRLLEDEKMNPQLGDKIADANDPLRGFVTERVSNDPAEVQGAILSAINKIPPKSGTNIAPECSIPSAAIGASAVVASVTNGPNGGTNNALVADPSQIFAGPLPEYRPSTSDGFLKIIWRMFGDPGGLGMVRVDGGATSPNQNVMGQMFLVLNTAIAAIAAIWFTFTMGSAMLQGGHDGEFLGKRYHSFWLPIRTVLGAALIIPIPGAGYSLAQVITILAATTGIGIANAVAGFASEVMIDAAPPPAPFIQPIMANQFSGNTVNGAHCVAMMNRSMIRMRGGYNSLSENTTTASENQADKANIDFGVNLEADRGLIAKFGAKSNNTVPNFEQYGYTTDFCGTVEYVPASLASITLEDPEVFNFESSENKQVVQDVLKDFSAASMEVFANYTSTVSNITHAYFLYEGAPEDSLLGEVKKSKIQVTGAQIESGAFVPPLTAEEFFGTDWTNYALDLPAMKILTALAGGFYNLQVLTDAEKAKTQIACNTKTYFKDVEKNYGWIGVGFNPIATISNSFMIREESSKGEIKSTPATQQAANQTKGEVGSTPSGEVKPVPKSVVEKIVSLVDTVNEYSDAAIKSVQDKWDDITQTLGGAFDDIRAMVKDPRVIFEKVLKFDGNSFDFKNGFSSVNQIANTGLAVLAMIESAFSVLLGIIAAVGAANVAISFTAVGPAVAMGVMEFINFALTLTGAFLTIVAAPAGYMALKLALFIPMIPVLKWIGAILNCIVIVIEAMIAAPYWAMAHLEGEGEGLGRNTAHGYIFMLNLLFRPAILVITFALITTVLSVILGFANGMLGGFLQTLMTGSSFGFIGKIILVIGGLALMVSIFENMLTQSYDILQVVPDKVFNWIGGSFGSNVGANLDSAASAAGGGAQQALSSGAGAAQSTLSGVGGAGVSAQKSFDQAKQEQFQKGQSQREAGASMEDAGTSMMKENANDSTEYEAGKQLVADGKSMQEKGHENMKSAMSSWPLSRKAAHSMKSQAATGASSIMRYSQGGASKQLANDLQTMSEGGMPNNPGSKNAAPNSAGGGETPKAGSEAGAGEGSEPEVGESAKGGDQAGPTENGGTEPKNS